MGKIRKSKEDCIRVNLKNYGHFFFFFFFFFFSNLSYFIVSFIMPEIILGRYVALILPTQDYCSANVNLRAHNHQKIIKNEITPKYRDLSPLMINTPLPISVWCTFDHGLCSGWNQSSSDDFDWTLASGSTPSSSTGPTTGQGGSG